MGIFGWSLPPGCSTLPGEESDAMDLTAAVTTMPADVVAVWWDEDGRLIESYPVTVPADPICNMPEYTEGAERMVGQFAWNDDLTDDDNRKAAASAYDAIKGAGA